MCDGRLRGILDLEIDILWEICSNNEACGQYRQSHRGRISLCNSHWLLRSWQQDTLGNQCEARRGIGKNIKIDDSCLNYHRLNQYRNSTIPHVFI